MTHPNKSFDNADQNLFHQIKWRQNEQFFSRFVLLDDRTNSMILDLILLLRTNSSWLFAFFLVILTVFYRRSRPKAEENGKRRGVDRSLTYARQYPCGWYRICNSDDVKQRGRLKHVAALGREMIVFRSDDENAEICVMDAFCSHMGANLGFGGKVIPGTNCVQCPFHLWEFEGKTGRCTKVPYLDGKIPDKVREKSFLNSIRLSFCPFSLRC